MRSMQPFDTQERTEFYGRIMQLHAEASKVRCLLTMKFIRLPKSSKMDFLIKLLHKTVHDNAV